MNIRTEINARSYLFKIFIDDELFCVIKDNYPKFGLIVDLLRGGYELPKHCLLSAEEKCGV